MLRLDRDDGVGKQSHGPIDCESVALAMEAMVSDAKVNDYGSMALAMETY